MARVIVTGASGFVGGHMAARLAAEHEVVGLGRRPVPLLPGGWRYLAVQPGGAAFDALLADFRPEWVAHCAGTGDVGRTLTHPAEDFAAGPAYTFALLDALRQHAPGCAAIFCSSAAVHGEPPAGPDGNGARIDAATPLAPISPYGFHKAQCEAILREFSAVYGLDSVVLRVFSAYGPHLRKQIFWDICRKAQSGRVELFGTGRETRDFIHASDLGRLAGLIIGKDVRAGVFPVGTGVSTSVAELAGLLVGALGRPEVPVVFRGDEHRGYPAHWRCDASAIAGLGFAPQIGLEEGAREYARWFLAELAAGRG